MKKSQIMTLAVLAAVGLMEKYESVGAKIDSQEADYKAVSQQLKAALQMPEDAEPEAAPVVQPLTESAFHAALAAIAPSEKIDQVKLVQDLRGAVFDAMNDLVSQIKAAEVAAVISNAETVAAGSTVVTPPAEPAQAQG